MRNSYSWCAAALLGCLIGAPAAFAGTACQAPLAKADAAWSAVGPATPSKPMQARVMLRDGHVSSGPEVTWLGSELRFAATDCALGRDAAALQRLERVQDRLSRL